MLLAYWMKANMYYSHTETGGVVKTVATMWTRCYISAKKSVYQGFTFTGMLFM